MTQIRINEIELTDLSEWKIPTEPTIHRESQIYRHPDGLHVWRIKCERTDWLNRNGKSYPPRAWVINIKVHNGEEWFFDRNTLITYEFIEQGKAIEEYVIGLMESIMMDL